jgi:hypothetical protein
MSVPDCNTACCDALMKSGDHSVRGSMLPQRSTRYTAAASNSRLLLAGDDHSACSSRCIGERKLVPASGVTVADTTPGDGVFGPGRQLQRVC